MSSLAASKSDNFYFPPDWRPEYGGISKFQGSKGSNQYEKYGIVRFELPFDGWCLHCKRHMSKGLRFNAKKDHTGDYYTTKIFSFTMKCYSCDQQFIIRTNPKERTYDFAEGLRKHEQEYTPDVTDGVITILSEEEKLQIANDPMYKLQHTNEDELKARTTHQQLIQLQDIQEKTSKKDYDLNTILRKKNRAEKHKEIKQIEEGKKNGLNFPLLDYPSEEDHEEVEQYQQQKKLKKDDEINQAILKGDILFSQREKILSQSIFSRPAPAAVPSPNNTQHRHKTSKHSSEKRNVPTSSSKKVEERVPSSSSQSSNKKRKIIDLQQLLQK